VLAATCAASAATAAAAPTATTLLGGQVIGRALAEARLAGLQLVGGLVQIDVLDVDRRSRCCRARKLLAGHDDQRRVARVHRGDRRDTAATAAHRRDGD